MIQFSSVLYSYFSQDGRTNSEQNAQPDDAHQKVCAPTRTSKTQTTNIADIWPRLEAATSRLEDIAGSIEGAPPAGANGSAKEQETSHAATQSQTTILPVPESKPAEPLPRQVEQFDELIDGDVTEFVQAADKVGGLVEEQVGGN